MNYQCRSCAVLLLACFTGQTLAQPQSVALHQQTQKLAALISDGAGQLSSEVVVYGPPPANSEDAAGTAVVLFGIDSWHATNHSLQFMAVFVHDENLRLPATIKARPWRLTGFVKVGDDHTRWYESLSLNDDVITAQGKAWTTDDPHCCPSQTAITRFKLGAFQIGEIKGFQ